jgi:DNA-binding NarL/FixJ family response regulator
MLEAGIHILIIEDDRLLLQALAAELERAKGIKVVGGFKTIETAFKAIPKTSPDVILLDLTLPGKHSGLRGCEILKRKWPRISVLIFSGDESLQTIRCALSAGADGYLLKSANREELTTAIYDVHRGLWPMSPRVRERIGIHIRGEEKWPEEVSPTERWILSQLRNGKPHKEIAEQLKLSIHTVREHLRRARRKLAAGSSIEAASIQDRT